MVPRALVVSALAAALALLFFNVSQSPAEQAGNPSEPKPRLTAAQEQEAMLRYRNVPEKVKALVSRLQKLRIKVDAGIAYEDYNPVVEDLHADVMLFAESREAKRIHELALFLVNASASYTIVRTNWNAAIFGKTNVDRAAAKVLLAAFRGQLWAVAEANIDAAAKLMDGATDDVLTVLVRLNADEKQFDPRTIFEKVKQAKKAQQQAAEREKLQNEQNRENANRRREQERNEKEAARWRDWTKADGEKLGRARFSHVIGDGVTLKTPDQKTIAVSLKELCDEDQKWIRQHQR